MKSETVLKIIFSLIILIVAFIPELVMYGIWHLVDPSGFWEKTVVIALFGFFGIGISVALKFVGFGLWTKMVTEL